MSRRRIKHINEVLANRVFRTVHQTRPLRMRGIGAGAFRDGVGDEDAGSSWGARRSRARAKAGVREVAKRIQLEREIGHMKSQRGGAAKKTMIMPSVAVDGPATTSPTGGLLRGMGLSGGVQVVASG